MPVEIEAKMRLTDRDAMIHRLEGLGARLIARIEEHNIFYDTHDGELKSSDRGLRVRMESHHTKGSPAYQVTYITHKGPRAHGKLKSRSETEVIVDNPDDASALLHALGYHRKLAFEKRRTRYELDSCRVELDELPHIGHYVEIEGPSEAAVNAVRDKLGLASTPIIKASYIAMLTDHLGDTLHEIDTIAFGVPVNGRA
jgi:adenylate cyclase class 2